MFNKYLPNERISKYLNGKNMQKASFSKVQMENQDCELRSCDKRKRKHGVFVIARQTTKLAVQH